VAGGRRPEVSVVIPTRDRPALLAAALESVRRQGHPSLEVLVVNDGTAHPGPALEASGLAGRIVQAPEPGQVPARNHAQREARGRVVAMLDDDDRWADGHLERLLPALERGAVLAYAGTVLEVYRGGQLERAEPFAIPQRPDLLRVTNPIVASAAAYRRDLHDEVGWLDETLPFYWDWDWYLRVSATHPIAPVEGVGALYRVDLDGGNTTHPRNRALQRANLDLLERKHGLDRLEVHNFLTALHDPSIGGVGGP
jgi:glycosyltransferase involved in cell wall biosynthesis